VVVVVGEEVLRLVVLLPVGVGLVVELTQTVATQPLILEVAAVGVEITQETAATAAPVSSSSKSHRHTMPHSHLA